MAGRFARWTDIDIHFRGAAHTVGGQGFAAMSRKELLELLQARCRELGVDLRFRTSAPDVDELARDVRPGGRRRRRQLRGPGQATPDVFRPRAGPAAQQVHVARHRPGLRGLQVLRQGRPSGASCRSTATRTPTSGSTFIVEMHEDVWRARRLRRDRGDRVPARRLRRAGRRRDPRDSSPRSSAATRCSPTTPSG